MFEGVGFHAAAVRALTATFNRLTSQPFPHRVFASVAEGRVHAHRQLPASSTREKMIPGDVVDVVEALRERLGRT